MMDPFYILFSLIFWGCVLMLWHTYAAYPVLLGILAKGKKLPKERYDTEAELTEVVVLMAVYNEETVLEETVRSILDSDYPKEKLRVMIG